uniref:WD40 repeat-like protein n=1 Tax=Psilocybe cubensis TaxID=181762 RepID=A0A8H7XMF9_PSICU
MIGRWSRSRSIPTTHTPILHSPISNVLLTRVPSTTSVPQALSSESQSTRHFYPSTRNGTAALLTASIQYGVVARSMPLSGRVLTGYVDARMGFGPGGNGGNLNGNPNAQFTPNVTACDVVVSSPTWGPSARVAWGTRAGDLVISTAPRAMDGSLRISGGSGVQVKRCRVGDEHEGVVRDVKFVQKQGRWVVSAGDDGRVKVWDVGVFANNADRDAQTGEDVAIRCTWSSPPMLVDRFGSRVVGVGAGGGVVPDKCVRAEATFSTTDDGVGVVVGVGESGDVHVWVGRSSAFVDDKVRVKVKEVFVECPFKSVEGAARRVTALDIDPNIDSTAASLAFLIAYEDDPLFYRIRIPSTGAVDQGDPLCHTVEITPFGDPNFGPTSVVVPYFGGQSSESFVLVGDHMGCVSLYHWGAAVSPLVDHVPPLRTFEAHRDGASVTALWWDGLVLVTGSARGTTHVWDGISFAHLRSFVSPVAKIRGRGRGQQVRLAGGALALAPHGAGGVVAPVMARTAGGREAVRHIVVNDEKDVLVVAVGDTIMAWHADVVRHGAQSGGKGGVRGRHAPGTGAHGKKKPGAGVAKYIGQYEMRQTIAESRDLLDAERNVSSTSSAALARRQVEHRAGLDSLGLSEAEAVEYVLMLSRDEAAAAAVERARRAELENEGMFDEDVVEDDEYEDDGMSVSGPSPSVSSSASSTSGVSSDGVSAAPSPSASVSPSPSISSSSLSSSSSAIRARSGQNTRLAMAGSRRHHRYHEPARTSSGQPILTPSRSNAKVQVSSPWRGGGIDGGEPLEAGEEYLAEEENIVGDDIDPSLVNAMLDGQGQEQHFPPITGSVGTSPGEGSSLHGKGKEKERKVGSPSPSLVGKGKGTKPSGGLKTPAASAPNVNTSGSLNPTPSPSSLKPKVSVWGASTGGLALGIARLSSSPPSPSFSSVAAAAASAGVGSSAGSPIRPAVVSWGRPGASVASPNSSARSRVSSGGAIYGAREEEDLDDDLRFALELSLVEARSRGEDV